jgi:hypothetical protein
VTVIAFTMPASFHAVIAASKDAAEEYKKTPAKNAGGFYQSSANPGMK